MLQKSPWFEICAICLIAATACAPKEQPTMTREQSSGSRSISPPALVAKTSTMPDSADAVAILSFLKHLAPPGDSGFNERLMPAVPIDSVLAVVSDSGLVSNNVNEDADSTVVLSRAELRRQLATRHGRAFGQLGHLAYIASQPYPQYSKLTFSRVGSALNVSVAGWYVLTYISEHGRTRLRRVSYRELEGD